jgi:hypothetical protein
MDHICLSMDSGIKHKAEIKQLHQQVSDTEVQKASLFLEGRMDQFSCMFFYHWPEVIAILNYMRTVIVGMVLLELYCSFRIKHTYRGHHYIL